MNRVYPMTTQNSSRDALHQQPPPLPEPVHSALDAVERRMYDIVNSDVDVLRDASRHILQAGGKRVRPRLVLLSYAAAGGQQIEDAVSVAAAIELVHTASVVHDDINDHGVVRRGRPSVNSLWGRTFALLTGDYMFAKVYELMATYGDLNIIFADATTALVEGETLQASAVKEGTFTGEVYYRIIALKTAALFRASAVLGARLAQADADHVEALGQFGYNIGMAFQIVDDVLDLTAGTEQLGKTAGIDLEQGRGFAAAYKAAGNGGTASVAVVDEAATDTEPATAGDPMDALKRKMMKGDAVDKARDMANQFADGAIASLDPLPDTPFKQSLIALAHMVVDRSY